MNPYIEVGPSLEEPCAGVSVGPPGYEGEEEGRAVDGDVALVDEPVDDGQDPVLADAGPVGHRARQVLVPQVTAVGGAVVRQHRRQAGSVDALL